MDLHDDKIKRKAMKTASGLSGIKFFTLYILQLIVMFQDHSVHDFIFLN